MAWSEQDDDRVREFCKTVDVGKLTKCPKCGMGENGASEMMLAHFCTHKYCPFRDWEKTKQGEAEHLVGAANGKNLLGDAGKDETGGGSRG